MKSTVLVSLLMLVTVDPAQGQERKDIFANPENLKVLPEDISSAELSATMRGFALGTGSRCETCHVGEAGKPLDTFDFASDEKENKLIARDMLRMVKAINAEHIGMIEGSTLEVTCVTCHRGVRRPMLTGEVLAESLEKDGIETALTKYRELRDKYYGTHSYDFSENVLGNLAQSIGKGGDPQSAMKMLELNDEFYPDSFQNHWLKGEMAILAENNDSARSNFERALEIGANPRFEAFVKQRLDSLGD